MHNAHLIHTSMHTLQAFTQGTLACRVQLVCRVMLQPRRLQHSEPVLLLTFNSLAPLCTDLFVNSEKAGTRLVKVLWVMMPSKGQHEIDSKKLIQHQGDSISV